MYIEEKKINDYLLDSLVEPTKENLIIFSMNIYLFFFDSNTKNGK